jgi:hypothetical protein
MKLKLTTKHNPADNPGIWNESELRLYLKTEKHIIDRVIKAIWIAIKDKENENP